MQNTNIYIVIASGGLYPLNSPQEFYFDKMSAEFRAWALSKEDAGGYWRTHWSVSEVIAGEFIDKNCEEYSKFIKEKQDKIKRNIQKKSECKEKDEKTIQELESQLKALVEIK